MSLAIINLNFEVKKKLNIGTKQRSTVADIPIQRIRINGKEMIYIPGSTIKGVIRSSAIRIAHLLKYQVNSYTVHPSMIKNKRNDIICELFGAPEKDSKIYVEDAYIETNTEIFTHIRINEKYQVVEEGSLFRVEYIPIGTRFKSKIKCYDLSINEMRLLLASIAEMKYERFGKAGIVEVNIDKDSQIPEPYLKDPIIKEILEVMKSG
jgi:CRISPR/Cas system CSM-associated protein Csm3 (group 7 of RAMP superfamily)